MEDWEEDTEKLIRFPGRSVYHTKKCTMVERAEYDAGEYFRRAEIERSWYDKCTYCKRIEERREEKERVEKVSEMLRELGISKDQ